MIASIDIQMLEWIQQHRIVSLDGFFHLFTTATTYVSLSCIIMIGVFSGFTRAGLKKMTQVALTLFLAALISYMMKNIIQRDRPFIKHDTVEKLSLGGSPSFPSGHTLEAFAVATSLSLLFRRKRVVIPAVVWACLVGYSRMALGVHYPSDVLGGMATGILLAVSVYFSLKRWVNRPYSQT